MIKKGKGNAIITLVVVLALVFYAYWSMKNKPAPENPAEDVSQGSVNAGAPVGALAYADALLKYQNARFQLNNDCQAIPNKGTFKNGANIMIDNRASVARTVKVGSTFPIKAYGFKIVKLESASLPATWYVDCDSSKNIATILIQE